MPHWHLTQREIACHVGDAVSGLDQVQDLAPELGGVSTTSHDASFTMPPSRCLLEVMCSRSRKPDSEKRGTHQFVELRPDPFKNSA